MKGVLIVHHGTLDKEAKKRSFDVLYKESLTLADVVYECVVSLKIAKALGMLSLEEAMKKMCDQGVDDLHIYNTFVIPGRSYQLFLKTIVPYTTFFKHLTLEEPLLHKGADFSEIVRILVNIYGIKEDKNYLLAAHGSSDEILKLYQSLQAAFLKLGFEEVHLCLLDGRPDVKEVMDALDPNKPVVVCPFMMCAGTHIAHEVKAEKAGLLEDVLRAHDFDVTVIDQGL